MFILMTIASIVFIIGSALGVWEAVIKPYQFKKKREEVRKRQEKEKMRKNGQL